MGKIIINTEKCIKCNICSSICGAGYIEGCSTDTYPSKPEELEKCFDCGHCEIFCPQHALSLEFNLSEKTNEEYIRPDIKPEQIGNYLKSRRTTRNFANKAVEKETINSMLDIVRYSAPTANNSQTVKWMIIYDTEELKKLARLVVDWMRDVIKRNDPLTAFIKFETFISAWENGNDSVFRDAPHLAIAYSSNAFSAAENDGIIALAHLDAVMPAFGLGAFWTGFFILAYNNWKPLKDALELPKDHSIKYGLAFGYPKYKVHGIPRRNPLNIIWK